MAKVVPISEFKSKISRPATTSNFYVEVGLPAGSEFTNFLSAKGVSLGSGEAGDQYTLNLLCSEASLPGSSLATFEITSDYTGVTERHVHRRFYDDRIDLTFYVNADNYLPIRFFEAWMDYITGAANSDANTTSSTSYNYRMNYADSYTSAQGLKITKFERDSYSAPDSSLTGILPLSSGFKPTGGSLVYTFVRAFPISVSSMPVSYDASSLLKCTVSMTYIRYFIDKSTDKSSTASTSASKQTPAQKKEAAGQATVVSTADRLPGGRVYEANKMREGLIRSGTPEAEAERIARESFF